MKIVVLDGKTLNPGDNPWAPIEALGEISVYDRTSVDQIVDRVGDAAVVLTNKVPFDATTLAALPNLKFIAVTATGYNVVDVEAASKLGIQVSNVPEYGTRAVAQHVFAMLLSFLHRPYQHHEAIQDGQWQRGLDFSFTLLPIEELTGKTMGIISLGRIGRATAAVAAAFGMRVIAFSRTQRDALPYDGFEWVDQATLFKESDVISIHCPLTSENAEFVNADLLKQMKPTGILINTARGALIDEAALASALNNDQLAGALLDVTSTEPIDANNPLLSAKNCLITPHVAWATTTARKRMMELTAANVQAFLDGSPTNLVTGS